MVHKFNKILKLNGYKNNLLTKFQNIKLNRCTLKILYTHTKCRLFGVLKQKLNHSSYLPIDSFYKWHVYLE